MGIAVHRVDTLDAFSDEIRAMGELLDVLQQGDTARAAEIARARLWIAEARYQSEREGEPLVQAPLRPLDRYADALLDRAADVRDTTRALRLPKRIRRRRRAA